MSGSRLVRGTRSRLFLYLAVVVVVSMAVYVFHGAQLQLDDARKVADKCQQQQESLSAQLQVIFEYKLRVEKSLQQEKGDHRKTREELEKRAESEKDLREKESLEANNKYSSLQQQYKLLESQHEDLNQDSQKMRMTQLQGLEERSKLESQVQAVQAELAQVQAGHKKSLNSLNSLKSEYSKLEEENTLIEKQNSELLEQSSKDSNKINFLEKENLHLQRELEKATEQLESYQRNPAPPAEKPPEGKHDAGNSLKSRVKDSNASPSPASSVSSPAGAAAPDVGLNPDNQMNVLQQPLVNQDNADNKVRSSSSSSNAPPVADKLPIMKSSSKAMGSPGQQLGSVQFAAPFVASSSSRPAPAMLMQEAAIAVPPPHASDEIEQLQSRIDQMLNNDKAPKGSKEV